MSIFTAPLLYPIGDTSQCRGTRKTNWGQGLEKSTYNFHSAEDIIVCIKKIFKNLKLLKMRGFSKVAKKTIY